MKASTIGWHLARDNGTQLARFCEKHATRSETRKDTRRDEGGRYFERTSYFDNGGYIVVEMKHGDERRYTTADYLAVLDYKMGDR